MFYKILCEAQNLTEKHWFDLKVLISIYLYIMREFNSLIGLE